MDASHDSTKKLVEEIEKELVDIIRESLSQRKLTAEQAEALARDFLAILPPQDKHDLLLKLQNLSQKYPPVTQVFVELGNEEVEEKRHASLDSIAQEIKLGNIEKALDLAKGAQGL